MRRKKIIPSCMLQLACSHKNKHTVRKKINYACCMQAVHAHDSPNISHNWIPCKKNKSTMLHASPQTNCTKKINAKQPHCIVRPNMRKKRPQRQLIFLQAMDLEFAARTSIGLGWHLILLTDFKLTVSAIKLSLSPTLANLDKRNRAFLLTDSSRLYFEWRVKTGKNNRSIALKRRRGIVWIRSAKDSDCKISSTT